MASGGNPDSIFQGATLAPHPPIAEFYATAGDKRAFLTAIFDETAADYDRIERWLSLGTGSWYRRQALLRAGLREGMDVMDVAAGTGLVAREALAVLGRGGRVVGVDPSAGMLRRAAEQLGIEPVIGTAEALPAADRSFDFLSMGYALRHVENVGAAFCEFRRVLRPGGRLCILEITRPASAWGRLLLRIYLGLVGGVLKRIAPMQRRTPDLWRYYWKTIDRCVPPDAVVRALREAGFCDVARVRMGVFSEFTACRPAE